MIHTKYEYKLRNLTIVQLIPARLDIGQFLLDNLLVNIARQQERFAQMFQILVLARMFPHVVTECG